MVVHKKYFVELFINVILDFDMAWIYMQINLHLYWWNMPRTTTPCGIVRL